MSKRSPTCIHWLRTDGRTDLKVCPILLFLRQGGFQSEERESINNWIDRAGEEKEEGGRERERDEAATRGEEQRGLFQGLFLLLKVSLPILLLRACRAASKIQERGRNRREGEQPEFISSRNQSDRVGEERRKRERGGGGGRNTVSLSVQNIA